MLPESLQSAIDREIEKFQFSDIKEARAELTDRYRHSKIKNENFITSDAQRCSYLVTRMPATYAVIYRVLQEVHNRLPNLNIQSLMDLGAGPGSVMWAACDIFPSLVTVHQAEQDKQLIALGKRLASQSPNEAIVQSNWLQCNLEETSSWKLPPQDLVVLSYSIGELSPKAIETTLQAAWNCTNEVLVIIEPGTPVGFERIRKIRTQLIAMGGHMIAPCPHAEKCPMTDGDWCHFSQRISRSSMHRHIKGGTLGHEDEKFSYIAVSKKALELPFARILRHPLKRSGHLLMSLCTNEGIKQETISKKTPERYKLARNADWGDSLPEGQ